MPSPMHLNFGLSRASLKTLLLVMGLGSLGLLVIYLGLRLYQTTQLRQEQKLAFTTLQTAQTTGDYPGCISQGQDISQDSPFYSEAQTLLAQCQLSLGQALITQGEVRSGLVMLLDIPQAASTYGEAQAQAAKAAQTILQTAENQITEGDFNGAIVTLANIPPNSPAAAVAQELRTTWRNQWQENQALITKAQDQLDQGQWLEAQSTLENVKRNTYWDQQVAPLNAEAEEGLAQLQAYEAEQQRLRNNPPSPEPTPNTFQQRLESLYNTYTQEGMNELYKDSRRC